MCSLERLGAWANPSVLGAWCGSFAGVGEAIDRCGGKVLEAEGDHGAECCRRSRRWSPPKEAVLVATKPTDPKWKSIPRDKCSPERSN
uniref:Uncharacterized protein n=1 Tax=Oryza punctata TaxID=4537 RepID=A0A0E0M5S3_ORYPU